MKFSTLSVGLLTLLTPLTAAWSKEGELNGMCPVGTLNWPDGHSRCEAMDINYIHDGGNGIGLSSMKRVC